MQRRRTWIAATCLTALAGCSREPAIDAVSASLTLSPESVAEVEALIARDGEAAVEQLLLLVGASPVDLPGGELDRLGRLLIERSDRERLLERLHAQSVARPPSAQLEAWLARLHEYERSIVRGVDVPDDYED